MPSVTLNKGQYWIGNPKSIFQKWEASPSCTYREGIYSYHAFKFKNSYIAVVPSELVEQLKKKPKDGESVTFDEPFVFYEQDGKGFAGTVEL